ncbi:hypothetical protein CEE37_14565 [candidate division LCP-89 bacterium B3_LCP]|uniref:M23ase beta-sheet core domain-containing protein n=1 Tax=candidate division LCP-89 bacterium B3_LCP TaxID=2012998 RepID=A0A532UPU0_UNCL8|nr:MAG: hypothetical protein CEE37_14565 [candidate division LCP-89 bacterium B3_LCP]
MKGQKATILIVPDLEGTPHTFKVSYLVLKIASVVIILGFVLFLVILFTWSELYQRANQAEFLALENQQYRAEHQRVAELEDRVKNLKIFENQIRRALGADLELEVTGTTYIPSDSNFSYSELAIPDGRLRRKDHTPFHVSGNAKESTAPVFLQDFEVPSLWPVEGFISRGFEYNPVVPGLSHCGIDIVGKEGEVVKATAGGIVTWCGWSDVFGNLIVLAHSSGYFSVYGHNQVNLVKPRQFIDRGTPIALLGNTGQSSAPHLHFEIWLGSQPLDPIGFLTAL